MESHWWVLFGDDIHKLLEVYSPISIFVCVCDHLLDLGWWKSLPHFLTDFRKLLYPKRTTFITIENFEQLLEGLLTIGLTWEPKYL